MHVEPRPIRLSAQGKLIAIAILAGLVILLLSSIWHTLTPFIAAIITAYVFNPLVSLLHRRVGLNRVFWILVLYVIAFSILYGLGTWVWPRAINQYEELVGRLPDFLVSINETFQGYEVIEIGPGLVVDLTPLQEQIISAISDLGRTLSEGVPHLVFSALETVIYVLVYLIVTFYLLLQSQQLSAWIVNLIPAPYRHEICNLGHQIDQVLGAYIRGQLMLIVIMAVLTYIPLTILNVPYAIVIAFASGVLELIPILGPWAAASIAMSVAFFQTDIPFGLSSIGLAGLIGITYFVLRQIEDSFIIPNIMGHLVKLHPAVVIFVVLAGGTLAGALGLFLSIPTAAVIRILLVYLYSKLIDTPPPDLPGPPPVAELQHPAHANEPASTTHAAQSSSAQPAPPDHVSSVAEPGGG
jgi:predicted PurR-regulated permease PerM